MKLLSGLFTVAIAFGIAGPAQALPNVVESKGVTYVAKAEARRVSGVVTSTGATLWTLQLTAPADITLSLALEKDVLYVTGYSDAIAPTIGLVWALDAATGQIIWFVPSLPGGGIYSSATVSKDVVYVAGAAGGALSRTSALNAATGALLWQTNTTHPVFSSPVVAKDVVVLASGGFPGFPTFLIVLDAATGAALYAIPAP